MMPKGLYARSLLIVILPMVLLQSVVAYFFMERHWQLVTFGSRPRVVQDIAAIIEFIDTYPQDKNSEKLTQIAQRTLDLDIEFLPKGNRCRRLCRSRFSRSLDSALSQEISRQIARPFWIDTVGRSNLVEIRILLG